MPHPAHRCSMLWQASDTSRRSAFSSALIDGLVRRLDVLTKIGIPHRAFRDHIHPPLKQALQLVGQPEVKQVEAILGAHDRIVGSGRCILVFALRDGSEVWVNTEDCVHLGWITRRQNGKADETIFERFKKSN